MERQYIAIDLKSFYASVECMSRGLDPLKTNLVVADHTRTQKTICLAVSPSLKSYGISGRARLFEAIQKVREVNRERKLKAPGMKLTGKSVYDPELKSNPNLAVDFIVAQPRMSAYMAVSTKIFEIYLEFVSAEDVHVYSVDEVFIDATPYLKTYNTTARELAMKMIREVLRRTGITATAGIGTNMYLCKIAMDIVAKHIPADKDGVRIAELDEMSYRRLLWDHKPLTDFWRLGKGIAARLDKYGIYTMGELARFSLENEKALYKEFGVNAELLIDHAWGWEPCLISDIKNYKTKSSSLSSGQVLRTPYPYEKARLVCREMTDSLVMDLVNKGLVTGKLDLTVCYDVSNINDDYNGKIITDRYGRQSPKEAHGSIGLPIRTASSRIIIDKMTELFDKIVDRNLTVRRIYVVALGVTMGENDDVQPENEEMDIFTDVQKTDTERKKMTEDLEDEKKLQKALLDIRGKFGKNAIVRGMDLEEGATAIERNGQVGGHKA